MLTPPVLPCMMNRPQAGWAIAALRSCGVEESPYSAGQGAGEIPGRSDLSDRATETSSRAGGQSEMVV